MALFFVLFFFVQDVHTRCVNQPASYSTNIEGISLTAHLNLMQRSRTGAATGATLPFLTPQSCTFAPCSATCQTAMKAYSDTVGRKGANDGQSISYLPSTGQKLGYTCTHHSSLPLTKITVNILL